ncbi:ferritin-like domain-containing protein [Sphingomonas sp. PB1R3]
MGNIAYTDSGDESVAACKGGRAKARRAGFDIAKKGGAMEKVSQVDGREAGTLAPEGNLRRNALIALLGGAALTGFAGRSQAQVSTSVDKVPLQFALHMQYLSTNYLQFLIYGDNRQLPAQHIRGGELSGDAGVIAQNLQQVKFPSTAERILQSRIQEIADEHWYQTLTIRGMLRADCVAQTFIDYRPEAFTQMFRMAGAIGANDTFSPYTSPTNCLLGADALLSVQASTYASILASMTDPVAMAMMMSMAASLASNVTSVRSMLYDLAGSNPQLIVMMDKLAAWRDAIDGTNTTDRGMSPVTGIDGNLATRLTVVDADGAYLARSPQQALNVLFMTSGSVTKGGFFPNGINGGIVSSAAN